MTDFLTGKKHVHFIGIGGSGMFPLAQILHKRGFRLTGSDNNETDTLKEVRIMGIEVFIGHSPENFTDSDLVVYSAAIMSDNAELMAAREKGIEVRERAELLGLVTSWYDKAICVTGTHGKTTTSSMLVHIFLADNVDASAVVGGKLRLIKGSARLGKSQTMICEACEFNDTFLKLYPNTTIILNIDEDHMDYFKTLDNLKASFTKFCDMTTDILVINGDDENTVEAVKNSSFNGKVFTFGYSDKNDFYPDKIVRVSDFQTEFTLIQNGINLMNIVIYVPGEHNVINAVAACAASIVSGRSMRSLNDGLSTFWGASRRFERLFDKKGIVVIDDYAHHPAEIKATLKTAKEMKSFNRIWAIHQPFTYSRTAALLDDFADALNIADKVILTEIMGSRENNTFNIHSKDLSEKIAGSKVMGSFLEISNHILKYARTGDMIITLGCGDVYKVANLIASKLNK